MEPWIQRMRWSRPRSAARSRAIARLASLRSRQTISASVSRSCAARKIAASPVPPPAISARKLLVKSRRPAKP
jgi:hypothetical protein